ncbi:MAG: signal peptidase I [Candidatus Omnitrophica bacterium]|jgi:signal peptidase I|nr:signal peptidase I [Candidatus Omnitrophota bacterium]
MFRLIKTLIGLFIIFGIGYLFGIKGIKFYKIPSNSMEPTLVKNERIIGINVSPSDLKRGDIITFLYPKVSKKLLVKRIIGLSGDTVLIENGNVFINNKKIIEPYIKEKPVYSLKAKVPEGDVFVLGDNRNNSYDSSIWGPLPMKDIQKKIIMIYWPFKKISLLSTRPTFKIKVKIPLHKY